MDKIITVRLSRVYEIHIDDCRGDNIDEKKDDAIRLAHDKLDYAFTQLYSYDLMDAEIIPNT